MIFNFLIDLGIFAVGFWLIALLCRYDTKCGKALNGAEIAVGSILCLLIFARVYYILLMLLFPIFILPCYYMPDCCPCKKCLMRGHDDTAQILESLEETEWTY